MAYDLDSGEGSLADALSFFLVFLSKLSGIPSVFIKPVFSCLREAARDWDKIVS